MSPSTRARKVLVTGGAGYLGSHVVELLGDRAIVYDRLLYTDEYLRDVEFARADVNDHRTLQTYLDRADAVVWLAALVGDPACQVQPELAVETNERAVAYLADHFDGPIIYTSSCSAYGVHDGLADEESAVNPQSLYAETKINAEKLLRAHNALILRLGTLHGASSRMRFDLVVNVLTLRAVTVKRIEVYGGEQWRPMLGVREAAALIVEQLDRTWTAGIYNVASENVRIVDLAARVGHAIPDIAIDVLGSKYDDPRNYKVSSAKAEHLLGFRPQADSIDRSIREIKDLICSGRLKNTASSRYINVVALQESFGA